MDIQLLFKLSRYYYCDCSDYIHNQLSINYPFSTWIETYDLFSFQPVQGCFFILKATRLPGITSVLRTKISNCQN